MSAFVSSFHDVLICRAILPSISGTSTVDSFGHRVQRLNREHIAPPRALAICDAARLIVSKTCGIDVNDLSVEVQTTKLPTEAASNQLFGGAVLLLKTADLALLVKARRTASDFARLLNRPKRRKESSEESLQFKDEHEPQLKLEDLVDCPLLGAVLPEALDLVVPDYGFIRVEGRFPRLSRRGFVSRPRTLRAHLRSVKVGGKSSRLTVRGIDADTAQPFGDHAIVFDESLRAVVAQAVAAPEQRLLLTLAEESLDDGSSKRKVKRVLVSLAFDGAADTEQQRPRC